jgi:acid stress chaperone HdeA
MKTRSITKAAIAIGTALMLTFGVSACGAGAKGGATTCGEYKSANDSGKKKAVQKMLEEHGDSTSSGNVTLTRASVRLYCETVGSDSDPISNVYG